MTNETMATLAELNAKAANTRWNWSEAYVLERRFAVGRKGGSTYRGTTGDKIHLLEVQLIVEESRAHQPGTYKVGQYFSTRGSCGGVSGQQTAHPVAEYDTDKITCSRCLTILANHTAYVRGTK